jgi:predicted aconitase with swiveling domain
LTDPPNATRPLPAGLDRARALTRLLDSAGRVPGTNMRFGLDPVLGLVPGLGDVAGAGLAGYVVLLAVRHGAPRAVVARMVGNVAVDAVVGSVPLVGDLFDAGWKANTRNLALLEGAIERPTEARAASRAVVAGTLVALLVLAAAGVAVAVLVVRLVASALHQVG